VISSQRVDQYRGSGELRSFSAASPRLRKAASPRVDVKFPILGFLIESAMTGYDLKRLFRDTVGHFYPASDGSLYPALRKLDHDGLVRMRVEHRGRRARKVYSVTEAGRAWFLARLEEQTAPVFVHDEPMIKLYFGHHRPQSALRHLEQIRRLNAELAEYLALASAEMSRTESSPFRRAVIEAGWRMTGFRAKVLAEIGARLRREIAARRSADRRRKPLKMASGLRKMAAGLRSTAASARWTPEL